ncbi:MAG: hypothetical protein FD174_114 [Geobacteraceae bacterium]|nr:MAG: hypothetical protein FD174_114 [Geobacteraceae bacterium]
MRKRIPWALLLVFVAACFTGCGGGTTGGTAGRQAVATMKAVALPAGSAIGGISLTLNFPKGVTFATDSGGKVAGSVVQITGVPDPAMTQVMAEYTPAGEAADGKLKIIVLNAVGFGPGETVTIKGDITPGYFPKGGDFTLTDFDARDLNGISITDILTYSFTADIS